ncbi:hypothetical protein FOZ62_023379 [Perkinsus olseni]|uniref:V-SNARE coiled-coil homology domain-containing protein n=1 Tax=Perkinsus olseni TaxID=32597 RepID=A0A7J6S4D8_PEROL|nr:hypothetical protein FOZ62_023379 [Perkinsus olseni]
MPGSPSDDDGQVGYLAVARLKDRAILLSHFNPAISSRERSEIETVFFEEIHKSNAAIPGSRRVTDTGGGASNRLHVLADSNALNVYVASVKKGYPVSSAWELCEDLRKTIESSGVRLDEVPAEGLSRPNRKRMKELMNKYNNPGDGNKAARVREKVEEVQGVMQDNVRRIVENQESAESLGRRTEDMNRQAHVFLRQSADLRRQMQIRNIKLKIILGVIVICIIVYIIVPIVRR